MNSRGALVSFRGLVYDFFDDAVQCRQGYAQSIGQALKMNALMTKLNVSIWTDFFPTLVKGVWLENNVIYKSRSYRSGAGPHQSFFEEAVVVDVVVQKLSVLLHVYKEFKLAIYLALRGCQTSLLRESEYFCCHKKMHQRMF